MPITYIPLEKDQGKIRISINNVWCEFTLSDTDILLFAKDVIQRLHSIEQPKDGRR